VATVGERASCRGEPGLDLEVRAGSRRQRALCRETAARNEERARVARLGARDDEAALHRPQPCEALELAAHLLERLQPVAKTRRVLVAARLGELCEAAPDTRQRERRALELVRPEQARRDLRPPARADRPL